MTERQIIRGCLKGDVKSQKALYIIYAPMMKAICMRYAASETEAEDVLQEAFIKVYTKLQSFKCDGPLGAWIRRVVINTALEIYRKEKKYQENYFIDDFAYSLSTPDDIMDELNTKQLLEKIQKLPDGYRVIFNLYAVEGYSHKEIAEKLDISIGTSKSQYSRAKAAIRQIIESEINYSERAVG